MDRLKSWVFFLVIHLLLQNNTVFCMGEDSEEECYIPERSVHFLDDTKVEEKSYSVAQRWEGYEGAGCKHLVESLVGYKTIECFIGGTDKIGKFDGPQKRIFTFFSDGHLEDQNYDDFISLVVGDEAATLAFKIDGFLYNIQGNRIAAGIKTAHTKQQKKRNKRCVIS